MNEKEIENHLNENRKHLQELDKQCKLIGRTINSVELSFGTVNEGVAINHFKGSMNNMFQDFSKVLFNLKETIKLKKNYGEDKKAVDILNGEIDFYLTEMDRISNGLSKNCLPLFENNVSPNMATIFSQFKRSLPAKIEGNEDYKNNFATLQKHAKTIKELGYEIPIDKLIEQFKTNEPNPNSKVKRAEQTPAKREPLEETSKPSENFSSNLTQIKEILNNSFSNNSPKRETITKNINKVLSLLEAGLDEDDFGIIEEVTTKLRKKDLDDEESQIIEKVIALIEQQKTHLSVPNSTSPTMEPTPPKKQTGASLHVDPANMGATVAAKPSKPEEHTSNAFKRPFAPYTSSDRESTLSSPTGLSDTSSYTDSETKSPSSISLDSLSNSSTNSLSPSLQKGVEGINPSPPSQPPTPHPSGRPGTSRHTDPMSDVAAKPSKPKEETSNTGAVGTAQQSKQEISSALVQRAKTLGINGKNARRTGNTTTSGKPNPRSLRFMESTTSSSKKAARRPQTATSPPKKPKNTSH